MRTIDLFAGCGGLSLGFKNAGFNIVASYESWEAAINCYKKNFSHPIINFDLTNVNEAVRHISHFNPEVVIGGPPCQDFSHAGKRTEFTNASLTCSFAKIITSLEVPYFVMENVDRSRNSEAYNTARKIFKMANYGLTELFLNASLCGVPQLRKRFFCIGVLEDEDNGLLDYITKRLSQKPMTVRDYLGDELGIEHYYRHPRNYNRRAIFSIDEPGPTVRGVNRPVPPGYKGHKGDPVPLTKDIRPLTTQERARLQTFPKNFIWVGSKTDLEQMIGNAVPVKQAELVANSLLDYISLSNFSEGGIALGASQ